MRLITVERCQPGMKLGKTIRDENGKVLLCKGTELTSSLLAGLKRYRIFTIYIDDDESEGIEIIESIPAELRAEAVSVITEGLNSLVDRKGNESIPQRMMQTGRAVRSFQKVFKDILDCLSKNRVALNLLATAKVHDNYLYSHCANVAIYSCQLAIANGLPIKKIEEIGLGALLHDLGKMYIPPEVINKPDKLTNEEYDQIKTHCELGFDILRKFHEIPLPVSHCALQHHERLDGRGYPRGLKGDEIHQYAKILSVADVFDALTSHRVYRPAMLPHRALEILYAGSGTQFEIKQVQLFKDSIAVYPQGVTVTLNDGRKGIVSDYNFKSAGRPIIRVTRDEEQQVVTPYEIDLSSKDHLCMEIVEAEALL
ncbi:HD-GYP domain-containing protein [Alkalihalobacterium elongatum]|uniref:HD-GYP domain-containing protein n=1 Tax=Alkalihalobacterium elongatum TaxID=2675466 RepID=UPI001C1FD962|nr:HD-GYP domain-containing protein [Alkalihalobacterium elongatum]